MRSTSSAKPKATESSAQYWQRLLSPYAVTSSKRAAFQLVTTAALFVLGWVLMLRSLEIWYPLTLLLAIPTAGLLVRLFIFQHDCGHGAFFKSKKVNDTVGAAIGVLMLTPYRYWRRTHAHHHSAAGDLDRRGLGDVETLTVDEYLERTWWGRLQYRLYRSLPALLIVGPAYQFFLKHRLPLDIPFSWKREWASVLWTNFGILCAVAAGWWLIGIERVLLVHLPIMFVAFAVGVWLFYVQHQFEDTYWRDNPEWDFHRAGLEGSSYYALPTLLHWFTGNIGFHHIHHLSSRIPNYRLKQCYAERPELHKVTRLSLWESFKCARLKLWDRESQKLVSFSHLASLKGQ